MNVGVDLGSSTVKVATEAGVLSMRGLVDPELSSRIGTTAPVVRHVGNALSLCAPHEAYVLALSRVLGETPGAEQVAVAVPDWWSPRALDMVSRTLSAQYPGTAGTVGAGAAAVRAFSVTHPLADPVVAVLDIGATCASATIVSDDGLGEPRVIGPSLVLQGRGGDRLDSLLLHHVLGTIIDGGWSRDRSDPDVRHAARQFLRDIRAAKEQFSNRPVVRLAPSLPGFESELRLVRAEFDDVARPVVEEIVGLLTTCIASSEAEVGAVLLVGGGAPIPMLTQMISVELGLPVLLDDEPASTAARGAVRLGLDRSGRDKRSRGRMGARHGGRVGRRAEPRPPLAARIVSLPAPAAVPAVQEQASRAPSGGSTVKTTSVQRVPSRPAKNAVPAPTTPVTTQGDGAVASVAQFPAAFSRPPSANRHAAPPADRSRPGEQVGNPHYRGRRRADSVPPAESAAEPESAEVEPPSPPRSASRGSQR